MAQIRLPNGERPTKYFAGKAPPRKPWKRDPRPPEAVRWLDSIRHQRDTGTLTWSGPITVGEHTAEWFKLRAPALLPSTKRNYATMIRILREHRFAEMRLDAVRPNHVQEFLNDLLAQGKATRTVAHVRMVLNIAMGAAHQWERVSRNPVTYTKVQDNAPRYGKKAWSPSDARLFLAALNDDPLHSLWSVLVYTGVRQGEARALRWEDVDLERGILHVRGHLSDDGKEWLPGRKGKPRDHLQLPIVAPLKEALAEHKRNRSSTSAYMFTRQDGKPFSGNDVRRACTAACKRAGVPLLSPHEFRHTTTTLLIHENVPPLVVASITGHTTTKQVEDTYFHPNLDEQRKALEALSDRLSG